MHINLMFMWSKNGMFYSLILYGLDMEANKDFNLISNCEI